MSVIADHDFELLETWLDGELGSAETMAIKLRLAADAGLRLAADELRAEREMRRGLFESFNPSKDEADRTNERIWLAIDARQQWHRRLRVMRTVGAAAACLVIGLIAGLNLQRNANRAPLAAKPLPEAGPVMVALTGDAGNVIAVETFPSRQRAEAFEAEVRGMSADVEAGDAAPAGLFEQKL